MDWCDKFKRFIGLPEHRDNSSFNNDDRPWPQPPSGNEGNGPFHGRSFNIFTDPLEMHRYFEQQISEMLRNFGFEDGFTEQFDQPQFGGTFNFGFPQIEGNDESAQTGDLREQYLKPGYENSQVLPNNGKRDQDIDGKLDIRDWGSVFNGESSVTPYQRQTVPKNHFFGKSVSTKTIRNPDGSTETHHTVRDSQGNEETTVTRKIGEKEHSITKRRNKDGKEEIVENLVNLDEKEIDRFFPKTSQPSPEAKWPFFDQFFR